MTTCCFQDLPQSHACQTAVLAAFLTRWLFKQDLDGSAAGQAHVAALTRASL